MRPPSRSTPARAALRPTPRPDVRDTARAVETPGAKTNSAAAASASSASIAKKPPACADCRTCPTSIPAPSSATSISNRAIPDREYDIDLANLRLAPPAPLPGRFDTVIHRIAQKVFKGHRQSLQDAGIQFHLRMAAVKRHWLAKLFLQTPDHRFQPRKQPAERHLGRRARLLVRRIVPVPRRSGEIERLFKAIFAGAQLPECRGIRLRSPFLHCTQMGFEAVRQIANLHQAA